MGCGVLRSPVDHARSDTLTIEQRLRLVDQLETVYLPGDRVESQAISGVGASAGKALTIRPARVDDMTKIINLTDEAKAWLRYKGTDQWSMDWPDQKARGHRVLRGMADTYRSAREGYDLFHELAHSELPVGQRSYVTKRVVPRSRVARPNQTAFAGDFVPFTGFHSYDKDVNSLTSEYKARYLFDAALTAFFSPQEKDSAEQTTRDHSDLAAETLSPATHLGPESSIYLRVNQAYAAILAGAYQGIMLAAVLIIFMVMGIMARVNILAASTVAVIATIMFHRHRHEPADGSLLQKTSIWIPGGSR